MGYEQAYVATAYVLRAHGLDFLRMDDALEVANRSGALSYMVFEVLGYVPGREARPQPNDPIWDSENVLMHTGWQFTQTRLPGWPSTWMMLSDSQYSKCVMVLWSPSMHSTTLPL